MFRRLLSWMLNKFCRTLLSVPVLDFSSGFRLYRRKVLEDVDWKTKDFSALIEILVQAYAKGCSVREIPMHYRPRGGGRSHARLLHFLPSYLAMFFRLWRLRNSLDSSDYDERAFYSRIPLQRYWQRRRYRIVLGFAGECRKVLDVGCGSSLILSGLDRKSTRLNSSHIQKSRMPSSA